jgi:Tfp pilus assembly protein PilO
MRSSRALFTQIAGDYRRVLGPLMVAALVNVGVFAVLVYPLTLKVGATQRRAAAAEAGLRAAERDSAAVHSMLQRTEQADKDLARFYDDVLPHDVSGARRLTYARLAALARQHSLAVIRRTYGLDDSRRGRLDRLEISMEVNGVYDDIREFLYALESAPEFVVIENVEVAEGSKSGTGLNATFHLATYFRSRAHAL